MWLNESFLSGKRNVGILIKQSLEDFGRCSSQFNDLIDVLRLEFHGSAVLP